MSDDIKIPLFIRNMGHRIVSYILNIKEDQAKVLLFEKATVNENQRRILESYIQICRQLRAEFIDQPDPRYGVMLNLPYMMKNRRHVFHVWRQESGGDFPVPSSTDEVILPLQKIALDLYPLFLVRNDWTFHRSDQFHLASVAFQSPFHDQATKAIVNDDSLRTMFSTIATSHFETTGYYTSSIGRAGSLQLSGLPFTIITNAYETMRVRGLCSPTDYLSSVEESVQVLRKFADGSLVTLPVFIGFGNVALPEGAVLETDFAILRSYNEGLVEVMLPDALPPTFGSNGKRLGFVVESGYPVRVEFKNEAKAFDPASREEWPKELYEAQQKLELLKENVGLALSLALERNPPVGVGFNWMLLIDPLTYGSNISWNSQKSYPVDHYVISSNEFASIQHWCSIICKSDSTKIRIAIRRVLSALNERLNPIDGFIDALISLENLFGRGVELKFRISTAIARLLAETDKQRLSIQEEVEGYYNDRSSILHGNKEIPVESARKIRNDTATIALQCLRKLYSTRHELIANPDRARIILLSDASQSPLDLGTSCNGVTNMTTKNDTKN